MTKVKKIYWITLIAVISLALIFLSLKNYFYKATNLFEKHNTNQTPWVCEEAGITVIYRRQYNLIAYCEKVPGVVFKITSEGGASKNWYIRDEYQQNSVELPMSLKGSYKMKGDDTLILNVSKNSSSRLAQPGSKLTFKRSEINNIPDYAKLPQIEWYFQFALPDDCKLLNYEHIINENSLYDEELYFNEKLIAKFRIPVQGLNGFIQTISSGSEDSYVDDKVAFLSDTQGYNEDLSALFDKADWNFNFDSIAGYYNKFYKPIERNAALTAHVQLCYMTEKNGYVDIYLAYTD